MADERFVFIMPESEVGFFAACTVLQNFVKNRMCAKCRKELPEDVPTCPACGEPCKRHTLYLVADDAFVYLHKLLRWPTTCRTYFVKSLAMLNPQRGEFSGYFHFDETLALELGTPTETHITKMFNIMLGGEECSSLPILVDVPPPGPTPGHDILFLPGCPAFDDFLPLLENNFPELTWQMPIPGLSLERRINLVQNTRMLVVGEESVATYIAAARRNLGVVEILPPSRCFPNWLSKWTAPYYKMIHMELAAVSPTLLFRVVSDLVRKVPYATQGRQIGVSNAAAGGNVPAS